MYKSISWRDGRIPLLFIGGGAIISHAGSNDFVEKTQSGCGAVWLARMTGGHEVAGSNPVSPTTIKPNIDAS